MKNLVFNKWAGMMKILLSSLGLFLLLCWSARISAVTCIWVESISFFAFSYFMHQKKKDNYSTALILLSLIIGRIILEIPIRAYDFSASLCSLWITLTCISSIVLGVLCERASKKSICIASSLILIYVLNILQDTVFASLGLK